MFELSVGSKVFLVGEYQVLQEGTAFLAVIEPRFKMLVQAGHGELSGVPQGSPAFIFHEHEQEFFKNWNLEFLDPHAGRGGFGASTAQVALLQGFKDGFASMNSQAQVELDLKKIRQKYLELVRPVSGPSPSGADLLGQIQGGLVELNIQSGKIQKHAWPFNNLQVYFFATGKKQATHEHLKEITLSQNTKTKVSGVDSMESSGEKLSELTRIYSRAMESFHQRDENLFNSAIADYHKELEKLGWVAKETLAWVSELQKLEGVKAAKGCGAMGADVIAVIAQTSHAQTVIHSSEALGLKYIGSLDQRTEGFAYKWVDSQAVAK